MASGSGLLDLSIDISKATTDIQNIILLIFRHFGCLGNSLFFIASAWFLLKSTAYKKKKWFSLFAEIWVVSIIILIINLILFQGKVSESILLRSVFPTLYGANWYMTCYLLFYPIHPILNGIIKRMNQVEMFRATAGLSILYIFLNFINYTWFFPSTLILWVTIYFIIAYIQKYLMQYADNIKLNILVVAFNAVCFIGLILLTEIGGRYISALSNKMMQWNSNCNPFFIFMAISMFNIARNIHFKNRFINYISGLSLLIYIIHENVILRTYYRTAMWNYVYEQYGYSHIVKWVMIMTVVIFIVTALVATLYKETIQKVVSKVSDKIYKILKNKYLALEAKILR